MTTKTIALNAAFLQEIKEDNRELRQLLGEISLALTDGSSFQDRWRRFVDFLATLRDHLATYFSLEEAYGYVDNPVSVPQKFGRTAFDMRSQHEMLYAEICAIVEQAERCLYHEQHASAPRKIVRRYTAFCERLRDHEAREHDLIWDAQMLNPANRTMTAPK
jgi:hypothetical protein